jgi:hypothetical protein
MLSLITEEPLSLSLGNACTSLPSARLEGGGDLYYSRKAAAENNKSVKKKNPLFMILYYHR